MSPRALNRVEVFCFRVPITTPVATSFGVMRDRPAVFVRLTDSDGAFGWGEVFANWPAAGAEHRARLLMADIADLVLGFAPADPGALFRHLTRRTHIRALQCGEWGPFRQVIAGLDIALNDLLARRAGLPLARFLTPSAPDRIPGYASGIHVARGAEAIAAQAARGHRAFKVKVGFGADDPATLRRCQDALPAGAALFADANQAWTLGEARDFLNATQGLGWIEEPLPADAPVADWAALAASTSTPIAAGENIAGPADFDTAIAAGHIAILQPDIAKWGGITGCMGVARAALAAGRRYCPHFLGGGIGLLASAHLLAAVGGDGLLEIDVNPNPLRDAFTGVGEVIRDGWLTLSDAPGLGLAALPEAIGRYETLRLSRRVGGS